MRFMKRRNRGEHVCSGFSCSLEESAPFFIKEELQESVSNCEFLLFRAGYKSLFILPAHQSDEQLQNWPISQNDTEIYFNHKNTGNTSKVKPFCGHTISNKLQYLTFHKIWKLIQKHKPEFGGIFGFHYFCGIFIYSEYGALSYTCRYNHVNNCTIISRL